ncbi:2OG-Fe(II) oxygenase superfamily protein [compost metagenome]
MDELATKKWSSSDAVFSKEFCLDLLRECQHLEHEGAMKKAAIGFGQEKAVQTAIRGDSTFWLSEDSGNKIHGAFLEALCAIREELNRGLYLGLRREEAHFAVYPPKTGYQKHVDNHRRQGHRLITFILYLNEGWKKSDGGALSIFAPENDSELIAQIAPQMGTFVLFCSDIFPHQVEESFVPRRSLTGWFRNDAL